MKKLTTALLTLLLAFSFLIVTTKIFAQESDISHVEPLAEEVDYDLHFSGMLPDSPFYMVKKARDHVHIFFTRDHIKKSELLLRVADKKVSMAWQLAEKEKWDLVVETLQDSLADSGQMIYSMETGQKIGTSPSPELVVLAQTSNEKREEIMKEILSIAPEKHQAPIEDVIKKNVDHFNLLDQL